MIIYAFHDKVNDMIEAVTCMCNCLSSLHGPSPTNSPAVRLQPQSSPCKD